MTHDELLYRMNWASERYHDTDGRAQYFNALRAVVELHESEVMELCDHADQCCGYEDCCSFCSDSYGKVYYPCPTIQAIEKELG